MWSFVKSNTSGDSGVSPSGFWQGFWGLLSHRDQVDNAARLLVVVTGCLIAVVVANGAVVIIAAKELHGVPVTVPVVLGLGGTTTVTFIVTALARKILPPSRRDKE